ncbi:MAG: 2-succinyl-5-enolpyruvyl-6-hydroxy-3-cyclohexene-1-carboxylic-acid synthase [Candidatus Longimicrobiales bacterium M2_2A_002]
MSPPTLLTEWARLLLGSLRRAGLRQVVLSPGSRSTPFTWAALQEPGLSCRTVIDERTAAFFALGHARITGRPVLLVSTSGSAAANYFSALVEAAESRLPVLVLTADRPLELQRAGAPQTIDQVKLYGDYARSYIELGSPDPDPRMLRAISRLAAQALTESMGPVPGPVHINARARKPLEPSAAAGSADTELAAAVDRLLDAAPTAIVPDLRVPGEPELADVVRSCRRARRGLIVCGPAPAPHAAAPGSIARLAAATGFPVVAEAASQLRFADTGDAVRLDHFPTLLDVPGFAGARTPDVVIQVGRPPTDSAWYAAMEAWGDTERHVLAAHGWPDPWGTAATMVPGPLDGAVQALAAALEATAANPAAALEAATPNPEAEANRDIEADRAAWRAGLRRADRRAGEVIDGALTGDFSEGAAVRIVVHALPDDGVLVPGNSLPIREVDAFVPGGRRHLTVCFQRGANGIDGLVSGAAGAAAAAGRPTTLLVGDVSLVHDLGGLALLRALPAPLTVVVLNNRGGRIFERLPLADRLDDEALAPWLTPPDVSFQAAAGTFGLPYRRAEDAPSLEAALRALRETGGVLEVLVPDGGTTQHQAALRRSLAAELSE